MSEAPEAINVDDGKWVRRDVFLEEFADEDGDPDAAMDELIEDGVMETMNMSGYEYIRGVSDKRLISEWTKQKAKVAKNSIKERATKAVRGDSDE